jgi:hypothetical protein
MVILPLASQSKRNLQTVVATSTGSRLSRAVMDQLHCLDSSWLITVLVGCVYKGKVGKLYEVLKGNGLVREAGVQDSPAVQRFYSLCQILWNNEPMYKELFPFGLLGCPLRYFITEPS